MQTHSKCEIVEHQPRRQPNIVTIFARPHHPQRQNITDQRHFRDNHYLSYYEGEILLRLNEVKEAISKWKQSLRASPPPRGVHFRLGNAYRDQGDAKKAKEHYQKAVSENPEHIEAINSLGGVVARTDPRKAMEYYENVIKLAPLFPIARFNVAALNVQLQNINLARRQLGELLQDSPDFEPATELLKSLDQHAVNNED